MKSECRCLFPVVLVSLVLGGAGRAAAEWPYTAEEASNLPEGRYSLSVGLRGRDQRKEVRLGTEKGPLLSRPAGTYWSVPELQGTLGVGSRAEFSFDYEYLHYGALGDGEEEWESGDLRLWSKLGLWRGSAQDLSLRFGVKLPNSDRLGTNEADIFGSALCDLHLGGWVTSANVGMGILGNPALNRNQDDVFVWAVAVRRQPAGDGLKAGVEAFGSSGPFGLERERMAITYAAVVGWQRGRWRTDGSLQYGIHDAEGWGWRAGVTYGY